MTASTSLATWSAAPLVLLGVVAAAAALDPTHHPQGGDGHADPGVPPGSEVARFHSSIGWVATLRAGGPQGISLGPVGIGSTEGNALHFDVPAPGLGILVSARWACAEGPCKVVFALYPPSALDESGQPTGLPVRWAEGVSWASMQLQGAAAGPWLLLASPGEGASVAPAGNMTVVLYS